MSADVLPIEGPVDAPPLARQPQCPACHHEQHSPVRCEIRGCQCADVPVNGVQT